MLMTRVLMQCKLAAYVEVEVAWAQTQLNLLAAKMRKTGWTLWDILALRTRPLSAQLHQHMQTAMVLMQPKHAVCVGAEQDFRNQKASMIRLQKKI